MSVFAFIKVPGSLTHLETLEDFRARAGQCAPSCEGPNAILQQLSQRVSFVIGQQVTNRLGLQDHAARVLMAALFVVHRMQEARVAIAILGNVSFFNLSLWPTAQPHPDSVTAAVADLTTGEFISFDAESCSQRSIVGSVTSFASTVIRQTAATLSPLGYEISGVTECAPFSVVEQASKSHAARSAS